MAQRLKIFYQTKVLGKMCESFGYLNIHLIPRLKKISINQGASARRIGSRSDSPNAELDKIVSQKSLNCISKKAIAGFKIRAGEVVGRKATLRRDRMFSFLDRVTNLAFPRIRDFQGLRRESFDRSGNFSVGLEEQLMFPEVSYDQVEAVRGLDICFVSSATNKNERRAILEMIGMPFQSF